MPLSSRKSVTHVTGMMCYLCLGKDTLVTGGCAFPNEASYSGERLNLVQYLAATVIISRKESSSFGLTR